MTDNLTKAQRTRAMQANRPEGRKTTEWALRARLIVKGISEWRMHAKDLPGKPDIYFPGAKLAIFVDGCFWHGCAKHRTIPETNHQYWLAKIEKTRQRDRLQTQKLQRLGWSVLRFWEHEVQNQPNEVIQKINSSILGASSIRPIE